MNRLVIALTALVLVPSAAHAVPEGLPNLAGPDIEPLTRPVHVVTVFDHERFTCTSARRTRTVAVPPGDHDRIILQYTYTPEGDPWDRTFSVALGGVEVLRGTSPRTEMTLRKDVTEYASLLPAGGVGTVTLSMDSYVGTVAGTVRLEWYDDEPTAALVRKPLSGAKPVFYQETIGKIVDLDIIREASTQVSFGQAAPARAIAELTMTSHARDEVWFQNGPIRGFHIFVDDIEVANVRPYPYRYAFFGLGNENANTACVGPGTSPTGDAAHPLMWWTAQRIADQAGVHTGPGEIPSYRAEIDPADLHLLTGERTVKIVMQGGWPTWPTSLAFLYP